MLGDCHLHTRKHSCLSYLLVELARPPAIQVGYCHRITSLASGKGTSGVTGLDAD
jgi:hypothetical protein